MTSLLRDDIIITRRNGTMAFRLLVSLYCRRVYLLQTSLRFCPFWSTVGVYFALKYGPKSRRKCLLQTSLLQPQQQTKLRLDESPLRRVSSPPHKDIYTHYFNKQESHAQRVLFNLFVQQTHQHIYHFIFELQNTTQHAQWSLKNLLVWCVLLYTYGFR